MYVGSPRVLNRGYTPRRSLTLSTALQENCEAKLRSSVPLHSSLSVWSISLRRSHFDLLLNYFSSGARYRAWHALSYGHKVSLVYSYIYSKKGDVFLETLINTSFFAFRGCQIFFTLVSNFFSFL